MAVFGNLDVVRAQLAVTPALAVALDHAAACLTPDHPARLALMALAEGAEDATGLDHGVTALSSHKPTKPDEQSRWETHRKFIDVQLIVDGEEFMEVADPDGLIPAEDRLLENDALFYQPTDGASRLHAGPGFVAVFFPADAHRASLAIGHPAPVRKVVIKVPV